MNKTLFLAIALVASTIAIAPLNAQTETTIPAGTDPADTQIRRIDMVGTETEITVFERNRAKNLARQTAERLNGGLGQYRAEASMHGPSANAPYVDNGDGTITFTFKGTRPGSDLYTYETEVTINTNTWAIASNYNGPVRAEAAPSNRGS